MFMDMGIILDAIDKCSFLRKLAEESCSEVRITQLDTVISNNFYDVSTIERLYVGTEMALSALNEIVEYADSIGLNKLQDDV